MNQNRKNHTGRYAPIYNRGYHISAHTSIHDDCVDWHTKGMGPKARAAFEDGWFDACEDCSEIEHFYGTAYRGIAAMKS